jgi:PAS domain S-box-containing protein
MKLRRSPIERLPSRAWIPISVLAGTLLLTGVASFYVQRAADARDQLRFERSVQEIHDAIDGRLETYVTLLRAGTGLFAASNAVELDEFRKFVAHLELPRHYSGIQGIGFSVRLTRDQKDQLTAKMRQAGYTDFQVQPEGDRPEYHSIIYLEPLDRRNRVAIGYDMFTEPVRRAAMEQARDTGLAVASGRVTLVQEIDKEKQPGFLIYAPVYRNDLPTSTVDERRAALIGFVYAPFRATDLLHGTLAHLEYRGIDFKVYDGAARSPENLLYDSAAQSNGTRRSNEHFMANTTARIAERPWSLSFTSGPDFESSGQLNFAFWTLLGGGLLSLLLFSITTSQTRAHVVAERALKELKQSEKSLRKSVAEQEHAEAALRKSEEELRVANYRFRVAEEASKSFHYDWNLETDTVVRSENFTQVLGYRLDEIAHTWEAWKTLTHPDDFGMSKAEAIEYLDQLPGDILETEYRVRHKDGRYRNLYNRGIILRDERGKARRIIGQTVDITERKLAEVKLHEANQQAIVEYERLLERIAALAQALGAARDLPPIFRALHEFAAASVPCDGLFVSLYDAAKDVRTACYAWGDGAELDVSDLPPMPVTVDGVNSRAVRSSEIVVIDDYLQATRGHPSVTVGPDNSLRPQSSMAVPMSVLGRVVGTIEVQSYQLAAYKEEHATAMRMAANLTAVAIENAQLLARESHARAEAEESNRLKDEFLATVSHELRTPLTAILGWARMLDSENLNEPAAARAIQTILRNAKSQAQIIDDILDVSRIVTGNLHLNLEPTELAPILEAAINVTRPAAEAKSISIVTNFDAQPVVVSGDGHRLQQIAWNLLSNAVKFTPQNGSVQVIVRESGSHAEIEVSDNGQGIRPAFLPYVFERFRQADSSTTRTYGGLGLGLAIVRHLVEIHGGSVQAQSDGDGKGAKFTVRLPLLSAARKTDRNSPIEQSQSLPREPSLTGVHVLLVDDDPATLEMISVALTGRDAKVTAVSSAREALAAIERSKPDVLVSDIAMPSEDGYELIEKVRALERDGAGAIPAVAITAYARDQDRRRALSSGYQSFLAKPIEPAELVSLVAKLAGKNAGARVFPIRL